MRISRRALKPIHRCRSPHTRKGPKTSFIVFIIGYIRLIQMIIMSMKAQYCSNLCSSAKRHIDTVSEAHRKREEGGEELFDLP